MSVSVMRMNYYELYYFNNRKDTGSIYITSEQPLEDFMDDDDFLNHLISVGKIRTADNISGINEITKQEYEEMTQKY